MSQEITGNVLVVQSGGPTAVTNASLAGVVQESLNHECIDEIYGGLDGIEGVLREDLIDLAEESQQTIRGLRHTPGAALGSCRYKMQSSEDYQRVLEVLKAHDIKFFFYIGGKDSQESALNIAQAAREQNYDLRVLGIPKTVDNDLAVTDHCPGYASAVKYIASTLKEMALDHGAMGRHNVVSVLEVMGRNSGWLAAGATLAKRRNVAEDPPHLILLPEVPFHPENFIGHVQEVLKKNRYCSVVVGEGLVDQDGNYLAASESSDAFGQAALGGVGEYIRGLVEQSLAGVKARSCKLGIAQRAAAHCASLTDNDEAFRCGVAAVNAAVSGATDKMVALIRGDGEPYASETTLVDLAEVAGKVKAFPQSWINEDRVSLNFQFYKYAQPLIQGEVVVPYETGTPKFVVLNANRIEKKLPSYNL